MNDAERPWPDEDLRKRIDRALGVALTACEHPPGGGHDKEGSLFTRHKFATETALFAYATSRMRPLDRSSASLVAQLSRKAAALARSDYVLTAVRLRPMLAPEMSMAHVILTNLGIADEAFDRELRLVLSSCTTGNQERLPWKQIESDWIANHGGYRIGFDGEAAVRAAAISRPLDVLAARRDELYAFTHGLIYATDFGHAAPSPLSDPSAVTRHADDAIAGCLDDDDFDLVAELALAHPYLGSPWSPTSVFALRVLTHMEDLVGLIPSMTLRAEESGQLSGQERVDYAIAQSYHAAYVMGLLLIATQLPAGRPPASETGAARNRPTQGSGQALHSVLPPRHPVPHWEKVFAGLDEPSQDALAELLTAIGVRRAVHAYDLTRVRAVVTTALNHGVELTPALQQGGELLHRFAGGAGGAPAGGAPRTGHQLLGAGQRHS